MKKIVIALTILIVLLLSACAFELPNSGHMAPPVTITFDTEEELQELLDAAELSNAEFDAFMTRNANITSYKKIESQGEVAELSALIQAVGTPVLLNRDLVENYSFTYKPEKLIYDVKYYINGTRYRFFYKPFEEVTDVSDMNTVASYDLNGTSLTMFQLEDDNVGNKRMFAEVYANGYYIQIIVNYKDINAVDFTPFVWSTEMQYIS